MRYTNVETEPFVYKGFTVTITGQLGNYGYECSHPEYGSFGAPARDMPGPTFETEKLAVSEAKRNISRLLNQL